MQVFKVGDGCVSIRVRGEVGKPRKLPVWPKKKVNKTKNKAGNDKEGLVEFRDGSKRRLSAESFLGKSESGPGSFVLVRLVPHPHQPRG